MDYFAASINESPVIVAKAGVELTDVRGKAVAFDDDGNLTLAEAGAAVGIALLTNSENISVGGDVDVQYKDIGLVMTGAAVKHGDRLAPNADGALTPATSGAYIAIALQSASTPGAIISAIIERGTVAANS